MGYSLRVGFTQTRGVIGLVAPLVLDGPINGPAFLAYVEQFLTPTLTRGDVVVIDNFGAHKVRRRGDPGGRRQHSLSAALLAGPV